MSEQIKYEIVCGDQALFDGVPEYIEVIRFNDYSRDYLWSDLDKANHLTFKDLKAIPIVAMRRIIKTPAWTKVDQEAGRLPDVGVTVIAIEYEEECKVAAINNDAVCVVFDDGEFITLRVSGISPIETPEGRVKREEDEFVSIVESEYNKMPNEISFKAGIRAAYRKLKGGE